MQDVWQTTTAWSSSQMFLAPLSPAGSASQEGMPRPNYEDLKQCKFKMKARVAFNKVLRRDDGSKFQTSNGFGI